MNFDEQSSVMMILNIYSLHSLDLLTHKPAYDHGMFIYHL
jgi:hypothetical protein